MNLMELTRDRLRRGQYVTQADMTELSIHLYKCSLTYSNDVIIYNWQSSNGVYG